MKNNEGTNINNFHVEWSGMSLTSLILNKHMVMCDTTSLLDSYKSYGIKLTFIKQKKFMGAREVF